MATRRATALPGREPPAREPQPDRHSFVDTLAGHHARVGMMANGLARRMGLGDARARLIGAAGARHDTGKLFLPPEILAAPRPLTVRESASMRAHVVLGRAALGHSSDPEMQLAARVALEHHERWDGSGYPLGVRGEAISIEARIVAVCDVYDSLRNKPDNDRRHTHLEAVAVLMPDDERPAKFDPAVLAAALDDGGHFLDRVANLAMEHASFGQELPGWSP